MKKIYTGTLNIKVGRIWAYSIKKDLPVVKYRYQFKQDIVVSLKK